MTDNKESLFGKPWLIRRRCKSFSEADNLRNKILQEEENIQAKIKRRGDDTFVVKTRSIKKEEIQTKRKAKKKR